MTSALEALIEKARAVKMSEEQIREQRISFVYGNTHIENALITREMVREADARVGVQNADESEQGEAIER